MNFFKRPFIFVGVIFITNNLTTSADYLNEEKDTITKMSVSQNDNSFHFEESRIVFFLY